MSDWQPHRLKESALREIEARLARDPGAKQLLLDRALLLTDMGRLQEAKRIYLDLLMKDPDQFVPFMNLGSVLTELGYFKEALKVYREIVQRFPGKPGGHVHLARALYKAGELAEAQLHYESVLQMESENVAARYGLSDVLMDRQREDDAVEQRRRASEKQPWVASRYRGEKAPIEILILASAWGGNAPIQLFLNHRVFLGSAIYTEFYTPAVALPPHQLVINVVGDADRCGAALDAAERLLERSGKAVINPPARIRTTTRAGNARMLGALEGVVTPRMVTLAREAITCAVLAENGFAFPLLLRTPGFHGGSHFVKVESPDDLATAVASLPGNALTVIQFLDARDGDGKVRKYRVMMIDGQLHPLHNAVSTDWKIHYFSAEMAESATHRAEDAAFLEDMPGVLGPRAMRALELIRDALGLDYAGADFSLGPGGEVLLFEANATMTIPKPGIEKEWDYRRRPVQLVQSAVAEMVRRRAG